MVADAHENTGKFLFLVRARRQQVVHVQTFCNTGLKYCILRCGTWVRLLPLNIERATVSAVYATETQRNLDGNWLSENMLWHPGGQIGCI